MIIMNAQMEDAEKVKESNNSRNYYWMTNKYGRKVPVSPTLVGEKLSRGFIHTDGVLVTDNPEERTPSPEKVDPMVLVADAIKKIGKTKTASRKPKFVQEAEAVEAESQPE